MPRGTSVGRREPFLKGDPFVARELYIGPTNEKVGPASVAQWLPRQGLEGCVWLSGCAEAVVAETRQVSRETRLGTLSSRSGGLVLLLERHDRESCR